MGDGLSREYDSICEEVYQDKMRVYSEKTPDDIYLFMDELGEIISYFRTSKFRDEVRLTQREFSIINKLLLTYDEFDTAKDI